MTREDKLYAMTGLTLIQIADSLGVKVAANRTRTALKEAKSKVIARILEAEAAAPIEEEQAETPVETPAKPVETPVVEETAAPQPEKKPKKQEKTIEPFVYADEDGTEWEDEEIGEMIADWSQEKKDAFGEYWNDGIRENGGTIEDLIKDLPDWSDKYDKEHGIEKPKKETAPTAKPKRGALLEYDGRAKNICAWAEELGISANTLYGRIYKMGWSIEKAFTTKPR